MTSFYLKGLSDFILISVATAKSPARLSGFAVHSVHSQFLYVKSTIITWAGSYEGLTNC